jgi:hypothetical protein
MALLKSNSEWQTESSSSADGTVSIVGGVIAPRPSPSEARAVDVRLEADRLLIDLADGRTLGVPLSWFPRLVEASERERKGFELIGGGRLIHWPAVDEDIDVPNLLRT